MGDYPTPGGSTWGNQPQQPWQQVPPPGQQPQQPRSEPGWQPPQQWRQAPDATTGPPASRGFRKGLALFLAVLLIGGATLAAALVSHFLHNTDDTLTKAAPANVDVYATAFINPSLQQKDNLSGIIRKFPNTGATNDEVGKNITKELDKAFESGGMSFSSDVRPWLGSQVSAVGRGLNGKYDSSYEYEIVAASTDDAKATAALTKLRGTKQFKDFGWAQSVHNGVTVWAGSDKYVCSVFHNVSNGLDSSSTADPSPGVEAPCPADPARKPSVFVAVTQHMFLTSNAASLLNDTIDTAAGKQANVTSTAGYSEVMAKLPSDRLGFVYVNVGQVVTV